MCRQHLIGRIKRPSLLCCNLCQKNFLTQKHNAFQRLTAGVDRPGNRKRDRCRAYLVEKSPATFAATVQNRLISRRAFATTAQTGERKLDRLIADGTIPVCRIGTAVLIDSEGAHAALAARRPGQQSAIPSEVRAEMVRLRDEGKKIKKLLKYSAIRYPPCIIGAR